MAIRILLVDDHNILREGLRLLLQRTGSYEVLGEAQDGREALQLVKQLDPDVVIMDVAMPELNGVEATRRILAERPDAKVLALSMHSDRRFVARMLHAGACGYLLKDCSSEQLELAIQTVLEGEMYLSPGINKQIIHDYVQQLYSNSPAETPLLTAREREVLQLLAEGKATREIAELLEVSVKTVESHRMQIKEKLNLRSVAELTKYAVREGLTTLEV